MWLALGQGFSILLGLVFVLLAARHLGVRNYGTFSVGIALGEVLLFLADFGMATILVREGSQAGLEFPKLLGAAFATQLLMVGLAEVPLAVAALWLWRPGWEGFGLFLIGSVTLWTSPTRLLRSAFRVLGIMKFEAIGMSLERLSVLGLGTAALLLGGGVPAVGIGMFVGSVVSIWAHLSFVRRRLDGFRPRLARSYINRLIVSAWPLAAGSLFQGLALRGEVLLIERLRGPHDVGLYMTGSRLTSQIIYIAILLHTVLLPIFSVLAGTDRNRLARVQDLVLRIGFACSVPLAVALYLFSGPIVAVLFPPDFREGAAPLRILAWSVPFGFGHWILSISLIALGEVKTIGYGWGMAFLLNLGLNAVLIPRVGFLGAAWARVATDCFLFLVWYRQGRLLLRPDVLIKHFPWLAAGVASAAMVTIGFVAEAPLGAAVGLGLALGTFWCSLLATRFFSREELRFLFVTAIGPRVGDSRGVRFDQRS